MINWPTTRVLVTGGSGFLGQHVVRKLRERQCAELFVPRSREYDLTKASANQKLLSNYRPDVVIHLAARVGGIGANRDNPATFFYDNLMMGVQLMHQSWRYGVSKFVAVGTVCAYPKYTPVPFKEEALWDGYPEETNAPYGLAKKMLLVQAQAYRQQYGFNAIYLLPVNLYGPGDNFDPVSSHVIPALIQKFIDAKGRGAPAVEVWGTGRATREFLYVADAAEAILLATERYDGPEPVNLGSGMEISIHELAECIKQIVGFEGAILFDTAKPDGQPRRLIDTTRAERWFGFRARTRFEQGLLNTIEWYCATHERHRQARTA